MKDLYGFHFTPEVTKHMLAVQYEFLEGGKADEARVATRDWQLSQYIGLRNKVHILDGFEAQARGRIPPGAYVLVCFVGPEMLPWPTMERTDIIKILYLSESSNTRHVKQWSDELFYHFQVVYTFWRPMLRLPMCKFARMNAHFLDWKEPAHQMVLVDNLIYDRSVGMVLECRDLSGTFVIGTEVLHCQDMLRRHFVKDLTNATVYGVGWHSAKTAGQIGPGVTVGHSVHRSRDPHSSIDLLSRHTFAMVIENVNADGYVSEKLYTALIAGCIPLYYGNNNELVGIPEDMYIDLCKISDSNHLQAVLDSLDIHEWKERIMTRRMEVLNSVSTDYFAGIVMDVLNS